MPMKKGIKTADSPLNAANAEKPFAMVSNEERKKKRKED